MLALRLLVVLLLILLSNSQKQKEMLQVGDNLPLSNVSSESEVEETNSVKSGIKNIVNYPNLVKFSSENISTRCREASENFIKSLENLELWALKSNFLVIHQN